MSCCGGQSADALIRPVINATPDLVVNYSDVHLLFVTERCRPRLVPHRRTEQTADHSRQYETCASA